MATVLDRLEVLLTADDKGLASGLNAASNNLDKFGKRATRVGRSLTTRLSLPLAGVGLASIKAFGDFDSAMTKSVAIMGDVSDVMRRDMVEAAKEVGRTTTTSATDAAESYFFLASAGLDAAQSIAALPQVAAFAQAGMFDMSVATDLATDAQSALGLKSEDAQENLKGLARVTDVLVKANTLANASVEQFSTALTTEAGAAMKSFGIDVEEGVAVLAAFADQGIKGEKAGSGFSRILRLMSKAANNNKQELAALGIEIFDSQGNLRNMADIIENLEDALGDMSDEQRTAALESIGFTARVQGMLLPLLGTSEAIREYEAGTREAGNTTQEVAQNQLKGFNAQMKVVSDNLKLAAARIGEVLAPTVQKLGEFVKGLAQRIEGLNPGVLKWAAITGALLAALGPVVLIVGQLSIAIGAILPVLAALTGPIGLVVAGVVAAGIAIFKWRKEIVAFLSEALQPMKPLLDAVLGVLKAMGGLVVEMVPIFKPFATVIGVTLVAALKGMQIGLQNTVAFLNVTLVPALNFAAGAIGVLTDAFVIARDFVVDAVKGMVDGVKTHLLGRLGPIFDSVKAGVEKVKGFFSGLKEAVVGGSFVPDMVDGIETQFQRLDAVMVQPVQNTTSLVVAAFSQMAAEIKRENEELRATLAGSGEAVGIINAEIADDFAGIAAVAVPSMAEMQASVEAATRAQDINAGKLKTANDVIAKSTEEATRAASVSFTDFAGSVVSSLASAGGSIKSFVKNALSQLGRLAGTALGGPLGGIIGGTVGKLFGGLFQHGGFLPAGQFGIVGEAGPELVAAGPRGAMIEPIRAATPTVAPAAAAAGQGRQEIVLRLDTSGMPPLPRQMSPDAVATDAWWRQVFSRLTADGRDRGVSFG